jgi:hypothetical protein
MQPLLCGTSKRSTSPLAFDILWTIFYQLDFLKQMNHEINARLQTRIEEDDNEIIIGNIFIEQLMHIMQELARWIHATSKLR